jgi:hypothetical protein
LVDGSVEMRRPFILGEAADLDRQAVGVEHER